MIDRTASETNTGPAVIAVCGKGGVGKTTISAMLTRALMDRRHARVLAVDADPAVGLATSLGMAVTKTVDQIRNDLVRDIGSGRSGEPEEILRRLDYDVMAALAEERNLAFLAIGRPEGEGCYCQVNKLLKAIISKLAASFDYVVIDGEAGIEQINRRVMAAVTHLLLVSDTSLKGINVCRTIQSVAASAIAYRHQGVIINRVRPSEAAFLASLPPDLGPAGTIPESEAIRRGDMAGRSIWALPACKALQALDRCLGRVLQI
jgi:CO dehydrogenase maturation factor